MINYFDYDFFIRNEGEFNSLINASFAYKVAKDYGMLDSKVAHYNSNNIFDILFNEFDYHLASDTVLSKEILSEKHEFFNPEPFITHAQGLNLIDGYIIPMLLPLRQVLNSCKTNH